MEGDMDGLVAAFISSTMELLAKLTAAESGRDLRSLQLGAHSIKSSAAVVGALRLSELARALEASAASGPFDRLVHSTTALIREFSRVSDELERLGVIAR
jgi:HPt (histidine-containing phosphotransfer) domain-containing protein